MNARMATRILGALFCILAIFLCYRAFFPTHTPTKPIAEQALTERIQNTVTPESVNQRPHKEPPPYETTEKERSDIHKTRAKPGSIDADQVFLKRIASLPLDEANFEVKIEVERRIKAKEKQRTKQIFSEETNGNVTLAYAVKQPSTQEIKDMLKLYQQFLNLQTNPSDKNYVDRQFQNLVNSYALSEGKYRLLYAIVPQTAGNDPVLNYSYPASTEQECMDILTQELAPKPPRVIGVPYTSRYGQTSLSYGLKNWRMDHLVPIELTASFPK